MENLKVMEVLQPKLISTKDILKMVIIMEKENLSGNQGLCTKEITIKDKKVGMEYTSLLMDLGMKVIGSRENAMDLEWKSRQMETKSK